MNTKINTTESSPNNAIAFLQVVNSCNQKCVFCNRPPSEDINQRINIVDIKKNIKEFSKNKNIRTLVFTGGETLLYPKLSEAVKYAKKLHFKIGMQTNGSLLHTQIKELKDAGLEKIYFAFHSHKKHISCKIRGTNYGFEKINDNLKLASKMGFDIHIIHVINSQNYQDMPEFVDYIHELNLKKFWLNFSLIVPEGWAWDNKWIIPRYIKVKPFLIKAMRKCDEYNLDFDVSETVPLCIVEGYEEHAISTLFKIRDIKIIDEYMTGNRILDFINPSNDYASKAPQCQDCKLNNICAGFYSRIKELYGVSDFIPFTGDPTPILKRIIN